MKMIGVIGGMSWEIEAARRPEFRGAEIGPLEGDPRRRPTA